MFASKNLVCLCATATITSNFIYSMKIESNYHGIQTRFVGPVSIFDRIKKHDDADGDMVVCMDDGVNGDPAAVIGSFCNI